MQTIAHSGNLKLSRNHRGWFILRYSNHSGQHSVHLHFPPHAFAQASASFDKASMFFFHVNDRPRQSFKTQIMIGDHSIKQKPSRAPRAQVTQEQRDRARDNRRRALAKTRAKMAAEGRVPHGTMRAKRDDQSSSAHHRKT